MSAQRMPSFAFGSPISPANLPPAFAEQLDSSGAEDSDTDLPFPAPLPRQPFFSDQFSPADFLASLSRNRHQTLADLRSELQARSDALAGELQTLVNDEYAAFLSLGAALQGGEEKCQEVKVGVLGFEKGVRGVRESVIERRGEVERLLKERDELLKEISCGRAIIAVEERVQDLEGQLEDGEWDSEDEDENEEEEEEGGDNSLGNNIGRLKRLLHAFVGTKKQVERLQHDMHPTLLASITERLQSIRDTLLLDLGTALKQAKASKPKGSERLLKILNLYGDLGASQEALNILKTAGGKT